MYIFFVFIRYNVVILMYSKLKSSIEELSNLYPKRLAVFYPLSRENQMKRFLIIGGLVLSSSLVPISAIAATFSQIFVYGDSLSDLGRASIATNGAAPPYSALTNGKFSNGPLWIEYLATKLGIDPNPTNNPSFANTNFAVGGATTGINNTIVPFLGGVQNQVTNSLAQVTNNPGLDPAALYVVWAGANDYLGGGITDPTIPVTNLSTEITTLIGRGAKNILVPNLPDLGKLPVTLGTPISADLNLLTQGHNAGLGLSLNSLSQINPSVKLSLLDVNSLFDRIVTDPSSSGFNNVTNGCLLVSCTNPDKYLFWDTIHPTTAGHKLIGDLAFETVSPTAVPEPTISLGYIVALGFGIAIKCKLRSAKLKDKELAAVV